MVKTSLHRFNGIALAVLSVMLLTACREEASLEGLAPLYERDVSGGLYDITPVRGERGTLMLHMDGDEYECSMCHVGFEGNLTQDALAGQHENIKFDHGLNIRCLNCHHKDNADAYIYHDGSEIPGDDPTRLCAKCHGPHYRDWSKDVHGRVNGSWDKEVREQTRLDCIQCHDPHSPSFKPMTADPPPVVTRFENESTVQHVKTTEDEKENAHGV